MHKQLDRTNICSLCENMIRLRTNAEVAISNEYITCKKEKISIIMYNRLDLLFL
jgi:hypothetical protein